MVNVMLMLKKRILLLGMVTALSSSLFISGCNFPVKNEQNSNQLTETERVQKNGMEQKVLIISNDSLRIGGQIRLPKQNSTGDVSAKIESKYFSALGNQCIQLRVVNSSQKRLFCHKTQNKWLEMPLLENFVIETIK